MKAALALAAVAALFPSPVSATETVPFRTDWVPPHTTIQLEAPPGAWGIRGAARQINEQVDGVHIFRYGTCSTRPELPCIKVRFAEMSDTTGGLFYNWKDGYAWIELNEDLNTPAFRWREKRALACHELGHTLGLDHHDQVGCLGSPRRTPDFSYAEIVTLNDFYGAWS